MKMPLPFIIGGIAIAAGITGVTAGTKGVKKIADAKAIVEEAETKYNKSKRELTKVESETGAQLESLGKLKVEIWKDFDRFSSAFEKIKNRPEFENKTTGEFKMPEHSLHKIEEIQVQAIEVLGTTAASAGAGVATGFAAYSGVMALGTASTGTAISSLSGVAATNAALAALGGGSLAAGGGGIALGSQVLMGAVTGPVVAVGGLLVNAKGNSSLEKAYEVENEVDSVIKVIKRSLDFLRRVAVLASKMEADLILIQDTYLKQVSRLENLVSRKNDYNFFTHEEKVLVDTNIKIVAILYKLSNQDLVEHNSESKALPTLLDNQVDELILESQKAMVALNIKN